MKSSTAMLITMIGLLVTIGGVGGIEQSVENSQLLGSMLVSIVGLLVMYCGVIALRVSDYYDAR